MKVSKKVAGVEYAIRDIVSAAKDLENQGVYLELINFTQLILFMLLRVRWMLCGLTNMDTQV